MAKLHGYVQKEIRQREAPYIPTINIGMYARV